MLNVITSPTALQAKRESDGTLTALAWTEARPGFMSAADYTLAELNGLITIHVIDPLDTGVSVINYSVN